MKKYLVIVFILLNMITINVFAETPDGVIKSGDSLKLKGKLGYNDIGANYYYQFATNTWDENVLDLTFMTELQDYDNISGNDYIPFTVDLCVNGSEPDFEIWSYYNNYIDYFYNLGTHIYLSNGDWSYATCFRGFVRIQMAYSQNIASQQPGLNFTQYTDTNNNFAVRGHDNFDKLLRFTDLVYYNAEDYNNALTIAKQFSQNNTIINNQNTINNNISDINDSINDDSIDTTSSNSFFNNFSTTDNGGISTVITAPLGFVRSITNTCSPISFTIFEETITLPCGDTIFWNRNDVQTFRNVWNVIIGGAFVYMLLTKLFKSIEDMKDPQSDKVEVMKL